MKIQSLFQVIFVLRLAAVESKRHGANGTSTTTSAANALRETPPSSWFPSFSVLRSLTNDLFGSPPPSSTTSSATPQRRQLSWADRWADGYDSSPISTQGLSKAAPDTDTSGSGHGGGDFKANNPYSFPVMPTKTSRSTTEDDDSKATTSTSTSNAKNSTKTNTTEEVDANTETITPWEYRNKTKYEHDAENNLSSDTNATIHNGTMHQHGNTTSPLLPPEKEQPASWYMSVVIIFLVLAIVLCAMTAMRNCRKNNNKRQGYEQIESHVV